MLHLFTGYKRDRKKSSSISSSSTISSDHIYRLIDQLKGENNRLTTRSSYYNTWTRFNKFIVRLDTKPDTWEDRLLLYVTYLIDQGLKSTTIKSYILAMMYILKVDGYHWNKNRVLLNSLTKACKLKNDTITTRLPITLSLLEIILFEIPRLEKFQGQPYLVCMYQTIIALGYHGLFRIGELTTGEHPIKVGDENIAENKDKILIIL